MPIHADWTITTTFSPLPAAVHLQYQLYLGLTPNTPSPRPSISSEDWAAIIEHTSVYRSTLPIGFWINGIIFLIKQDRAEEGGGGSRGCRGLWV